MHRSLPRRFPPRVRLTSCRRLFASGSTGISGTRLTVEETADGVLLKPAPVFAPTVAETVFGSLHYRGKPKTLDEMQAGIAAEARRRHARGR